MADTSNTAAAATATNTGSQPDPLLGRVINDRFKIITMLARGGMGKVYKAEQVPLGRICAVKVLNPNYAGDSDPEFHKRFFLEASIASKLSHPNTVTIFDYGRTDDDIYYMAMEYLEGRTLHRLIREEGPLEPQRCLHITRQICRSLREAHGLGVIHRDLKPANIYLIKNDEESDFVKVLDFGLVKNVDDASAENLTQTGLFMGSPKYMAPEQIRGEKVTARTDIYALGVVMYEMLTGKVPFDRGNSVNTLMAHVSEAVPPMREMAPTAVIPFAIEEVVYKCLQKRAEDRYASMDDMLAALKRAAAVAFGQGNPTGEFSTTGALSVSGEMPLRTGDLLAPIPSTGLTGEPLSGSGPNAIPAPAASVTPGPVVDTGNALATSIPVPEAPRAKSKLPLVLGAVVVLAIAGGAFVMTRGGPPAQPTGTSAASAGGVTNPTHAPTPRSAGTETPAAPSQQVVHVVLDSTPTNAEVFEGATSLGRTPLRLEWTGERGNPALPHTFTFRLENHREASVTLSGATLQHTAQLERVPTSPAAARPPARPTARPPARPTARTGGSNQHPAGYREIEDW